MAIGHVDPATVRGGQRRLTGALWAVAITLTVIAVEWGKRVEEATPWVKLGAAPLVGISETDGWDWRFSWRTAVAIACGVATWWWLPRLAEQVRLRVLLPLTGAIAASFALLLALSDGEAGVLDPVTDKTEYWAYQPELPPLRKFLEVYVDNVKWWPVHMRGHPPLFTMVVKFLRWIGLDGPWPVAVLSILGTAAVPMFVLVTIHRLAGNDAVRKLAPFLVLTPYAVWAMTSADIVYSANAAATVMTAVLAVTASSARRLVGWSLLLGASAAALMFSTYGIVTFSIVVGAVVIGTLLARRRDTPGRFPTRQLLTAVGVSLVPVVIVTLVFRHFGFWYWDGAQETKRLYWKGTAQFRTWTYFTLVNATVPLIALGPAFVHGLGRLRGRLWWPVGAAIAAMVVSTASQISKGEIERIWLIFYPWALVAVVALPARRVRWWLAAQLATAVILQMGLLSKW
jgi:methylthioxylose transferase